MGKLSKQLRETKKRRISEMIDTCDGSELSDTPIEVESATREKNKKRAKQKQRSDIPTTRSKQYENNERLETDEVITQTTRVPPRKAKESKKKKSNVISTDNIIEPIITATPSPHFVPVLIDQQPTSDTENLFSEIESKVSSDS
jgi:hypothetical protein